MFEEILGYIIAIISSSIVTILILLWFFIKNPEKIEKWISMFLKLFAYFSERAEKGYMATNIQSSIAEKRKKLGIGRDVLAYDVEIKWTDQDSIEIDLKKNKVITMMRPFRSQANNFATIVSLYVPCALLPTSRRYVDPNLMTSIDYTISKAILRDNPIATQYYVEREIKKHSDEIKGLIEKVTFLHGLGRLTRVLIPEIQGLSNLYPLDPSSRIHEETLSFANEIHRFETIEIPPENEEGKGIFSGDHIKMAVVPVGKEQRISATGISSHLNFIKRQLAEGILHFYIVSSGINNVFAKLLAERAGKELGLSLIFSEEYEGKFRGRDRKMFCALCSKESSS